MGSGMVEATGIRIARVAQRLGLRPVAPKGQAPQNQICAIADNGDFFEMADVLEELLARIEKLEGKA